MDGGERMEQCAVMSERKVGEHIIEACQRGERDAFQLLFEGYKDKVYSIALYFFGGDAATASDITQQVFLKLFSKIEQFKHDAEFTTWLYRMATNACVDEQRKRRRFLPFSNAPERSRSERRPQEDFVAGVEVSDSVKEAIATLKPKLRIAILLKYFDELSYEEIADVLNCSKGTVASRLNRGHKILAQRLGHLRGALVRGE